MKKWIRIAGWIVVGLTSLFFVQSGIQKLAGTEQMVEMFHKLGYPDWSRVAVGWVEIAGAVLLALPRLTLYAATALGILMIGAVASEVMSGQGMGAFIPGQWLILLALIAGLRFRFYLQSK
ncbi:DoxX family protein [Cohnella suwonensis]|uniref:DoxX family protein n=1 Tax=Cohnella suwonensis TaxID=696072 RepID=A0ABW0LYU0_9BACL